MPSTKRQTVFEWRVSNERYWASPPLHLPEARDLVRVRLELQFLVGDVVGDEGIERHRVDAFGDQRQRFLVSGLARILIDAVSPFSSSAMISGSFVMSSSMPLKKA